MKACVAVKRPAKDQYLLVGEVTASCRNTLEFDLRDRRTGRRGRDRGRRYPRLESLDHRQFFLQALQLPKAQSQNHHQRRHGE